MDLIKYMNELIEGNPELKKMIEEDDKYKEERRNYYLSQGFTEEESVMKSWDDYWKMAYEKDGVEFSIHKLTE